MKPWILATLVGVAGCATTSGGPRTAQRFTGYPYDVSDDGDRISGLVCGVNVDYTVQNRGAVTNVRISANNTAYRRY